MSLLNQDVNKRLTAKQALKHKWLTGEASNKDLGDDLKKVQKSFRHSNKLQQLLLQAMFAEMKSDEKRLILEELQRYKNKRKYKMSISRNELCNDSKSVSRRNSLVSEQEFIEVLFCFVFIFLL